MNATPIAAAVATAAGPAPASNHIPFSDVPVGSMFRVTRGEKHGERYVRNDGIYRKLAQSHSWDMGKKCDVIFALQTPCVVIAPKKPVAR